MHAQQPGNKTHSGHFMRDHLVEQFWDNFYGEQSPALALKSLLKSYRKSLPDNSRTAYAIDRQYPLDDIFTFANREKYFQFADAIAFVKTYVPK